MTKYLIAFVSAITLSFCCTPDLFADAGVPVVVVTATPIPAVVAVQHFAAQIPDAMPAIILTIVAFLAELLMRVVPTSKPRSILLVISGLFSGIGMVFTKLSVLADNLVQNIKDPTDPGAKSG